MPFDQKQYDNEYKKAHYDIIKLRMPKGKKELIKAIAEREGKSSNQLILECLEDCLVLDLHSKLDDDA